MSDRAVSPSNSCHTFLFLCSNFSNYRNRFSMPGRTESLWYRYGTTEPVGFMERHDVWLSQLLGFDGFKQQVKSEGWQLRHRMSVFSNPGPM